MQQHNGQGVGFLRIARRSSEKENAKPNSGIMDRSNRVLGWDSRSKGSNQGTLGESQIEDSMHSK